MKKRTLTAITRAVSPSLADCELTFLARQKIDLAKAVEQHRGYEECLARLGVSIVRLPAEPYLPDSVFVEDAAIVLDELAVITRPGATSRQAETESVADALSNFRPLKFIQPPATIEGGDVMRVGRTLYTGLSGRTNREGASQLRKIVEPYGYRIETIKTAGCLHLKTGCVYLGHQTILANRNWINVQQLAGFDLIDVPEDEPGAANTLTIGDTVMAPGGFPKTRGLIEERGFKTQMIEISELQKAEAGLTCLSLIFESDHI
ncbi:MAG TPA: arginine deiminase-related protein [Blastocatellia bacterium]|nr:arginine deiminase-related protein [Blastocatellia bacterium]